MVPFEKHLAADWSGILLPQAAGFFMVELELRRGSRNVLEVKRSLQVTCSTKGGDDAVKPWF